MFELQADIKANTEAEREKIEALQEAMWSIQEYVQVGKEEMIAEMDAWLEGFEAC
jgi:hypothetical protein